MLLIAVADVSRTVSQTPSRLAKVAALAGVLRAAAPDEIPVLVAYLSGELPQRQIGVGYASLRSVPSPAETPALTVLDVDAACTRIGKVAGKGSAAERKRLLDELFSAATTDEQPFLVRLLSGELRQGALDGVMTDAVAKAADVPGPDVRRAVMLSGSLLAAAQAALGGGRAALKALSLQVGRPLKPMLASSEATITEALAKVGGAAAVEWKLDGIRVQAHLSGGSVKLFTRSLDDITDRLPEVVTAMAALKVTTAVFDGELIALRADGRPCAFQDTASRAASEVDAKTGAGAVPLSAFLFDVLHLDGTDLLDLPDAERHAALKSVVPESMLMPRLVTDDADKARAFYQEAVDKGHEGVVVKTLTSPYAAGRRGAGCPTSTWAPATRRRAAG
jgi:ATP-dependent DNA ligase I